MRRLLSTRVLVVLITLAACWDGTVTAIVPPEHPAVDLTAHVSSAKEFAAAAEERGLRFMCAEGGGRRPWQMCMLAADGIVAVVPFGDSDELEVRLTSSSHDRVLVPLDPVDIYGVSHVTGPIRLDVEHAGRVIGQLEGVL